LIGVNNIDSMTISFFNNKLQPVAANYGTTTGAFPRIVSRRGL